MCFRPDRACSADTALELAMAAYQRAWLAGCSEAIGLGLSAVVASSEQHLRDHRIHAAAMTSEGVWGRDAIWQICFSGPRLSAARPASFSAGDAFYIQKARRFPNRAMLIGADALARLLDERWGTPMLPMLREFAALGTRFLVFGRSVGGEFITTGSVLDAARVPLELRTIFREIPGRWDASSTEMRLAP